MQSFDLSIERTLPFGMIGVGHLHAQPRRQASVLPRRELQSGDVDRRVPGRRACRWADSLLSWTRPNTADFNQMIVMESNVETHYNALVLAASKRFADGLMFNTNYTLSEADGQRPDVGHVLRREPAVRRAELPLEQSRRRHVRRRPTTGAIASSAASTISLPTSGAWGSAAS